MAELLRAWSFNSQLLVGTLLGSNVRQEKFFLRVSEVVSLGKLPFLLSLTISFVRKDQTKLEWPCTQIMALNFV